MRMRLDLAFLFVALLCGGLLPAVSPAAAKGGSVPVDVELVLAVDVSFSMDPEEQRLQREGYFEALRSPFVLEAIRRGINGRIAVAYVEWAGSPSQEIVAGWHVIEDRADVERFIAVIQSKPPKRLFEPTFNGR